MLETEKSTIINQNLEKVYAIAETYPEFVSFYKEKKILFQDERILTVKMSASFYGVVLTWKGEGIKTKNKSIEFSQTQGLLKGLKAIWIFERLENNLTKVTIKTIINFNSIGKMFEKIIVNLLVSKTTSKILSSLKYVAEERGYISNEYC